MEGQWNDKRFGTLGPIFLSRDKQYIYATSYVDSEENITRCILLDCEGNYISSFDCRVGENETASLYSIDDKLILIKTHMLEWYYFDKEENPVSELSHTVTASHISQVLSGLDISKSKIYSAIAKGYYRPGANSSDVFVGRKENRFR